MDGFGLKDVGRDPCGGHRLTWTLTGWPPGRWFPSTNRRGLQDPCWSRNQGVHNYTSHSSKTIVFGDPSHLWHKRCKFLGYVRRSHAVVGCGVKGEA